MENLIDVTSSSIRPNQTDGSVDPNNLIDSNDDTHWTSDNIENQTFTVHFRRTVIFPLNYTLTTVSYDHSPLEWSVFGSTDNKTWIEISHEKDDICHGKYVIRTKDNIMVCGEHVSKTYPIQTVIPISYLKVQQIGLNSCTSQNADKSPLGFTKAFYLSGIEIYGDIFASVFRTHFHKTSFKYSSSLFYIFTLFDK